MPLIQLKNISKYFSKVIANKDVSFEIRPGEILALLGENGAGKSTIMKILYGLYHADEGQILLDGQVLRIHSPKEAMKHGIAMIQQHFSLVSAHSVLENIILANSRGVISYAACKKELESLMSHYQLHIPLDEKCGNLDVGSRQKVEILKALYLKSKVLIMDEPTAVLTPEEAVNLMSFMRIFIKDGNSVVFITHKMKEVLQFSDRIIVMRNGVVTGVSDNVEISEKQLSYMMMGKELSELRNENDKLIDPSKICLQLDKIKFTDDQGKKQINDLSMELHKGEVLGIAGVSGNGQQELCDLIMGAVYPQEGNILLDGEVITNCSLEDRLNRGIGYVPVDRHNQAMIGSMTLSENVFLKNTNQQTYVKHGLIRYKSLEKYTQQLIDEYKVKAPGAASHIGELSGGNQQKMILAREVHACKDLLIMNQPTRGLDIGAIHNIHSIIMQEREKGRAILLISTELSELFNLSDRILVMFQGEFVGEFRRGQFDTHRIGLLMAGVQEER